MNPLTGQTLEGGLKIMSNNSNINAINCPECNSSNVKTFSTRKRGTQTLFFVAVCTCIASATDTIGYALFGLILITICAIKAYIKNKTVVECKDCWIASTIQQHSGT